MYHQKEVVGLVYALLSFLVISALGIHIRIGVLFWFVILSTSICMNRDFLYECITFQGTLLGFIGPIMGE